MKFKWLNIPKLWEYIKQGFVSGIMKILMTMQMKMPGGGGGGLLSPKSYVDVPAEPRKSDFLYTNFLPNYPPISIPFLIEKHPILPKLGAFYNNLLKITQFFNLGSFVSDETPPPPRLLY